MKYSTYTWDSMWALSNQPRMSKKSQKQIKLYINCIKMELGTQNPQLRDLYLKPSFKTGSDKINMFRETRNNTRVKGLYCTPWTHKIEPRAQTSAETGNNRTEPSDS